MPHVTVNFDSRLMQWTVNQVWEELVAQIERLPRHIRDDLVMTENVGRMHCGENVTSRHFVEVRLSRPNRERGLQQAVEDALLIANLLAEVTDVEVYHPGNGHFKFVPKGERIESL